jgi:penicillin-insensitive murein endopeptidase
VRISRNRYWGHPLTVRMVQKLGQALNQMGLPPIYIGDLSQPRGGPMPGDHASHQTGLDADIWFSLDPKPALAAAQRENPELPWVVARDQQKIDLKNWRPEHATMLRLTAQMAEVERIFVHWQIKKHLCETVQGDRSWLTKVRPWWGHTEHFHVRLACPGGSPLCASQPANPPGDGCGSELAWWLEQGTPEKLRAAAAQPQGRRAPPKLPSQCYGIYGKM